MSNEGFTCRGCGRRHEGLPFSYGTEAPAHWTADLAGDENSTLEPEFCVIKAEHYFVRARLLLPVLDAEDNFEWGVWVTLSRPNFQRTMDLWTTEGREKEPEYFGWLSTRLPVYPETLNLKTMVQTAPVGTRPHVLLEPTYHPLAVEQRTGITTARVQEIAEAVLHS